MTIEWRDGVVTVMALAVGDRALQTRSALSFIVTDEIQLIGMFPPNGFETIRPNAAVKIVFDSHPGRIFHANVVGIPHGVGQGQVGVSGMLARVGSIGGTKADPAVISIPDGSTGRS
jgi:multidrug resistance efflux pump